MTTIFTDDFSYEEIDIEIGQPSIGHKGRELILTTNSAREFRVNLSDEQLESLAEALSFSGFVAKE